MTFSQGNTKASKLTPVLVIEIREKYASGIYTQARLSREYHVSINTIRNVVTGVTWQNVMMITPQDVIDEGALRSMRKLDQLLTAEGIAMSPTTEDELAAMQRAIAIPAREFDKPSGQLLDRLAGYGVRIPHNEGNVKSQIATDEVKDVDESSNPQRAEGPGGKELPEGGEDALHEGAGGGRREAD